MLVNQLHQQRITFTDPGMKTRVLLISSGKGGVGKSSITVNLSIALSRLGKRVAIVDADVWGFSIPAMLGIDHPPTLVDQRIGGHPAFFTDSTLVPNVTDPGVAALLKVVTTESPAFNVPSVAELLTTTDATWKLDQPATLASRHAGGVGGSVERRGRPVHPDEQNGRSVPAEFERRLSRHVGHGWSLSRSRRRAAAAPG